MKKTKTIETYILPEEFEQYSKLGYVIFMSRPTAFGTYKAVKIELVHAQPEKPLQHFTVGKNGSIKKMKTLLGSWSFGFSMQ